MKPGLLIHAVNCGFWAGVTLYAGVWWAALFIVVWWLMFDRALAWLLAQEPRWRAWVNRKFEEAE